MSTERDGVEGCTTASAETSGAESSTVLGVTVGVDTPGSSVAGR